MDENAQAGTNESNAAKYLRQIENDFFISPASGLYQPKSRRPEEEMNIHINAKLDTPRQVRERPRGSLEDSIGNLFTGLAVLVSIITLAALILTVKFAMLQWKEMTEATKASRDAANTSAQALQFSQAEFSTTLGQMERQTTAQQASAGASWGAVGAMQGQITAAQAANKIAQDAFEAQTRPWIGIVGLPQFAIAGNPSELVLVLHNYGKSPAIVPTEPPFILGWWQKPYIRWASEAEKKNGNDWCRVEPFPSSKPTKELYESSIPVFQDVTQEIRTHIKSGSVKSTELRPRGSLTEAWLLGCIPYGGITGEQYKLFVMYHIKYDANHSAVIDELKDMRPSDE